VLQNYFLNSFLASAKSSSDSFQPFLTFER
jgi:hypothetical protein